MILSHNHSVLFTAVFWLGFLKSLVCALFYRAEIMKHKLFVSQSSLYVLLEASSMSAFMGGFLYPLYTLSPFPGLNGHGESHFCVFSLFFCSYCKYLYFFFIVVCGL